MKKMIAVELIALSVWGFQPDSVQLAGDGALEDLEIIAGHVWSAVGGVDNGEVRVQQVDPKQFGVEVAAGTEAAWAPGEEGDTHQITLATLRPFKPMDMMVVEKTDNGEGIIAVVAGLTNIRSVEIGGVNQFTAKNPIPSPVFGTVLTAPRPKIRFDTVQTSPNLTAEMTFVGGTIPTSGSATACLVFSGVAIKRG